jgi:hypothetical protein
MSSPAEPNKLKKLINWKNCFRLVLGLSVFFILFFYFNPKEILNLLYHARLPYARPAAVRCLNLAAVLLCYGSSCLALEMGA